MILKEDSYDVYIYVDDETGDQYYFDGEKLVKMGGKPEIGDKGDEDIRKSEDEERKKQIEKDIEDDPDFANDQESEEEKKERIKRIKDKLNSDEVAQDISNETDQAKYKDDRKKADLAKKKKDEIGSKGLAGFKLSLDKFIANELAPQKQSTYGRINKTYARSGIIKPGTSRHQSGKVPSMNVYFDQSPSWTSADVEVGKQAISSLNKYVKEGKIKVYLYYFANEISTDNSGYLGGGTSTYKVLEHIKSTRPDNVIIMTDADGEGQGNPDRYKQIGKVTIPGSVWFLWRKYASPTFRSYVKGRTDNSQFMI